jgi:hypothetical protein
MLLPVAIIGALGLAAYELLKKDPDAKEPQTPQAPTGPADPLRGVAPPGATAPTVGPSSPISPPLPNAPANPMMPQGPQINPTPQPSPLKAAETGALVAAQQPQPTDPAQAQPPLPPAPAAGITAQYAIVATNGIPGTNDSRLRVRSGPSTLASVVPGGEPASGGGIPKGATVTVTGATQKQMTPISYQGLTGWVYSGYLKAVSDPNASPFSP